MKRLLLTVFFSYSLLLSAFAQLPAGSIAPDWQVQDINGNMHSLYSQLNQGKVVFIDFFATWCGPCWNYHNTHALANLYDSYGPGGTNQVRVYGIEADPATSVDEIYGIGGSTQGNWTTGTPYPIIDNATLGDMYQINYYPTIYGICPDRTIVEVGQAPTSGLSAFAQSCPALLPFQVSVQTVSHVTCFGNTNGSINLSKIGGVAPFNYQWSNGASTQTPSLTNLGKGTYFCTATDGNSGNIVIGPIVIDGPSSLLAIANTASTPVNCSNTGGSLTVAASGGAAPYNYQWNNGATSPTLTGLAPGNYVASVTDNYGCTKSIPIILQAAQVPTASAGPAKTITCSQSVVTLNGGNSSTGSQYAYAWDTQNGNIVSGANSLTPQVNQAGAYVLTVLNTSSGCSASSTVNVTLNTTIPNASAGAAPSISCNQPTANLSGTGPTGANISKMWTTTGGSIVSGATTYTPLINGAGTYYLTVTNTTNGCAKVDSVVVGADLALPDIEAAGDNITCDNTTATLSGSTSSIGATLGWTGPEGFTSTSSNPEVTVGGLYTFTVTATNGCENSIQVQVQEDLAQPNVSVSGGTLTCAVTEVTLQASTTTQGAELVWTNAEGETLDGSQPTVNQPDTYTLTATGSNGCITTANVTVAENTTAPEANAGEDQLLNCNATALVLDGSASTSGNDITYEWTTADGNLAADATTPTPTVDEPGIYVLEVTNNANGCVANDQVSVNQNSDIVAQLEAQSDAACFGDASGSATISATGGSGSYQYEWSTGAVEATVSGLSAGVYQVTVEDSDNCIAQLTVTINQPLPLTLEVEATGQTAFGADDGTATASSTGGAGSYSYLWSNGATTASVGDLAPGAYTVSVTDANNCTAIQTVNINSFDCTVEASISSQNSQCFGSNNGSAAVNIDGGTEPYEFAWSNGATTPEVSELAPGNYTVSLTDGNNCPLTLSVSIAQPAELIAGISTSTETAFGANDGSASVNPIGGVGPYEVLWSNNATGTSISGLAPGEYTVSITDANGCQQVSTVQVKAFECLLAMDATTVPVSCFGANDGQAFVTPAGGFAPFTYQWSNGSTSPLIDQLTPGQYTLTVKDDKNCPLDIFVEITEPAQLVATVDATGPECISSNDGSIAVFATGGTGEYSYLWSDGQTGAAAVNLAPGQYNVSVSDQNGCSTTQSIDIVVEDTEFPQVQVINHLVAPINESGQVQITLEQVYLGSSDNCGISSIELGQFTGLDCEDIGEQEVTVTVTDLNGNATVAVVPVTIIDNSAPTLVCPESLTTDCKGLATYELPAVLDNCASLAQPSLVEGLASGETFPLGETTVTYTVTDAGGNSAVCSFVVTVPQVLNIDATTEDVSCFGANDGQIQLTINGGTEPYEYNWSNGQTGPVATGLSAGTYELSVFDAEGCSNSANFTIEGPTAIEVTDVIITNASVNQADGAIDISVNGGEAPYTYNWTFDGQSFSQEEDVQGLPAGSYAVAITDASGCVLTVIDIVIQQTVGLTDVQLDSRLVLSPNPTSGAITLQCIGGLPTTMQVEVFDITGKLVMSKGSVDAGVENISIDLGSFASGLYLVRLSGTEGVVTRKVALQR